MKEAGPSDNGERPKRRQPLVQGEKLRGARKVERIPVKVVPSDTVAR